MRFLKITVYDEQEMQRLGETIAMVLEQRDLVYLIGELGAGKTTLVRGIARGLGYQGRVYSPTFTLMNVYPNKPEIYHFDFYRLEGKELIDLGLEDYLEREGISLIEWPQAGFSPIGEPSSQGVLPAEALVITIELVDDDYDRERQVTITAQGRSYEQKIEELQSCAHSSH